MDWSERSDPEVRRELISHYVPLVKVVAKRVHQRVPRSIELDDLMSSGHIGLIRAVDRYDPERGIPFESFAMICINGEILEGLRSADWVPRKIRSKARDIDKAFTSLEADLGQTPTWEEIATEVGLPVREVLAVVHDVENARHASWEHAISSEDTVGDMRVDVSIDPQLGLELDEAAQILAARIVELDDRERTIATLYYYREMTPTEIGRELGVSESRVCQLHPKVIAKLRP